MNGGQSPEILPVRVLRFVRFSHTIFAMPFALGSMLVAADGLPPLRVCALIVLAMVFARTAAMAFNRLADWRIDQRNPRTVSRHTLLSRHGAIALIAMSAAAFCATTWCINPLCLWLSPVALAIVFFYSLTKRFTAGSHFFLGLALAVAPVGAWLAVRGEWALAPLVLALAVLLWVAGFDIIYATQDHEFDRAEGLRSLVVALGVPRSLAWAQRLHWAMLAVLAAFGWCAHLGAAYHASLALVAGALIYEHRSAARGDVAAINRAFFASNAFVGVVFVAGIFVDRVALRQASYSASSFSTFAARSCRALASRRLPFLSTSHIAGMPWIPYFTPYSFFHCLPSKYCGQAMPLSFTKDSSFPLSESKLMPTISKPFGCSFS